jgi:3-hydroxyacyl-[acyl-carrier-protein] dehydratase
MAENIAADYNRSLNKMYNDIIELLPYKSSFRFVDTITLLNENEVVGDYTFKADSFFYADHFADNPVTPGFIISEVMAQIGVVVLGIYLINRSPEEFPLNVDEQLLPLLTSANVSFNKMVSPGEKVTVFSKKQYFRFGKLKCTIEMKDSRGDIVANGVFSGFIKQFRNNK